MWSGGVKTTSMLLLLFSCFLFLVSTEISSTATKPLALTMPAAEGYGPGEFGSLTLCPPGGRSFMMAWSLACEMKRRKRSTTTAHLNYKRKTGYRPATLTEIQKICCEVGCEIRDLLSYCDPFGPWNSK